MMTHMERLTRMLRGESVDRPLCAAWGHMMNLCDRDAAQFAAATIALQQKTGFDFVKVMSNPYYLIEDTGLSLIPPGHAGECVSRAETLPVQRPSDWGRLPFPKVGAGALLREQEAISRIVDFFRGDVPVLATIFTPLMWLSYLAIPSGEMERAAARHGSCTPAVKAYVQANEQVVLPVLERLNEVNLAYMQALLRVGVSGFFYCTEHANGTWGSRELFDRFEGRLDRAALQAVRGESSFTLLHVCGTGGLRMDYVLDYPVDGLNWEDLLPGNPSLGALRLMTDKVLVGGLDRLHALKGDPAAVRLRLRDSLSAAASAAGSRFILSGGCDWKYDDLERLALIRVAAEDRRGGAGDGGL